MTPELFVLVLTSVLVVVQMLMASTPRALTFGLGWAAGPRDSKPGEVSPQAERIERAYRNLLETYPIFAASCLMVAVAGISSGITTAGAVLYLVCRIAYLPAYVFHVPMVRSTIWALSMVGLAMMLVPLFFAGIA